MKKQFGDNEEMAKNKDEKHPKMEELTNDESNADVKMAEETKTSEKNETNDGDNQCPTKSIESSESKATDCEPSSATTTPAISKALLTIIFNFI